jgi:hypothetical protein
MRTRMVIAVVAALAAHGPRAWAEVRDGLGGPPGVRPGVRIDLGACFDDDRDAMQRALGTELGVDASDDPGTVDVLVDCMAGGRDTGVIVEVHWPGRLRSYVYALDWHVQPVSARPRLIALALAAALDASWIGLAAIPPPGERVQGADPVPTPTWALALIGSQRSFVTNAGVTLGGGGVMPSRRLSPHVLVAMDLIAEGANLALPSGAVDVFSVSSSPRVAIRVGDRLHAAFGFGARLGMVRLHGAGLGQDEAAPDPPYRFWLGPTATTALGFDLTPGVSLDAGFEIGVVEYGTAVHDMGVPAVVLGGSWTSFGLSAAIAL